MLLPYHKRNKPVTGKQPLESLTSESECPKHLLVGHCCLRSSVQGARLKKVIGDRDFDRAAILLNMRREWQSYSFKAFDEKELPSLSILDFAVIPLKKSLGIQGWTKRIKTRGGRPSISLRIRISERASARRRRIRSRGFAGLNMLDQ